MQDLIDIHETSKRLGGIPVKTLYAWRHNGEGPPSVRVGRHVRYRPELVQAWVDGLKASGTASGDAA